MQAEYADCIHRVLFALSKSCKQLGGRHNLDYDKNKPGEIHHYEGLMTNFFRHPNLTKFGLHENARTNPRTLSEIADRIKPVNFHLVCHHLQLALLVQLQLVYEHYEHSPLSFFDDVSRRAFFQPLRVHPFLTPANKVNDRLRAQRQRFIEQCFETIDSSTYEISQLFLNQTSNSRTWRKANSSDFEDSLERSQCLERGFLIMCLVEEWELDIGGLQIREIKKLYTIGGDDIAEKICGQVRNKKKLANSLIPYVAARLKIILEENPRLRMMVDQHSAASNDTLEFIKKTSNEFSPNFCKINPKATAKMVQNIRDLIKSTLQESKPESDFQTKLRFLREFESICQIAKENADPKK